MTDDKPTQEFIDQFVPEKLRGTSFEELDEYRRHRVERLWATRDRRNDDD